MKPNDPVFTSAYQVDCTLPDGRAIRVRALRTTDREAIASGFERLSSRSRYLRFLTPKASLSPAELNFLTELDGKDHFALVAMALDTAGEESEGVAVGRFIRTENDPGIAEVAVTVSDAMQGKGIGSLLCSRLAEAARERGITHFRCYLHGENRAGQEMVRRVFPKVHFAVQSELIAADFPIGPAPHRRRITPGRDN